MSGSHTRKAQAIQNVLTMMSKQAGPQRFTSQVKLISAAPDKCQFEFKVAERDLNMSGVLHGGVSATVVDQFTSLSLIDGEELDPEWNIANLPVSTDLNVSYLGPAKEGDIIHFETELVKSGRQFKCVNCTGKLKESEKLVVTCRQTLFKA